MLREVGREAYADQFKGYDWASEEDAFMDGYNKGNPEVTYERLRAMGNNGVQEPVTGFENGALVGTKRLYTDSKFDRHGRKDKLALFCLGGHAAGLIGSIHRDTPDKGSAAPADRSTSAAISSKVIPDATINTSAH